MDLASRTGRFTPCENNSSTHPTVGWILYRRGSNPDSLITQLVAYWQLGSWSVRRSCHYVKTASITSMQSDRRVYTAPSPVVSRSYSLVPLRYHIDHIAICHPIQTLTRYPASLWCNRVHFVVKNVCLHVIATRENTTILQDTYS